MSETGPKQDKNRKKADRLVWGVGLVLLVGLLVISILAAKSPESNKIAAAESEIEQAVEEAVAPVTEETQAASADVNFDLETAKKQRILGNSSAPIKVSEFVSFTCGHCGKFYRETFDEFKTNYIDTGKAYLVFYDFPLNAPALDASKIARCIPEDRYFDFVHMLFNEQDKWAYDDGHLSFLKNKAEEYGLSGPSFDACVQSTELQDAILGRMKGAQQQWQINSTPSFLINNREIISGAYAYPEFDQKIQEALQKIENPEPAAGDPGTPESAVEGE